VGDKNIIFRHPLVIFVVIIIAVAVAYVLTTMTAPEEEPPPTGHPTTPQALIIEFNQRINDLEIREAMELTTYSFHPDFATETFANITEDKSIKSQYSDFEVKYRSAMDQADQAIVDEALAKIDEEYDITVKEYCLVYFTMTATWPDIGEDTRTEHQTCVMVGSNWYIYAPPYDQ
jgi:hypothetical protein